MADMGLWVTKAGCILYPVGSYYSILS